MAEKISILIDLEGADQVKRDLEGISKAGQDAFANITKSAEEAGGFSLLKPEQIEAQIAPLRQLGDDGQAAIKKIQEAISALSFGEVTQSIAALGKTGTEALEGLAAAAQKVGASREQIAPVESAITNLATRAQDSGRSFTELATNYDKARTSVASLGQAIPATATALEAVGPILLGIGAGILGLGVALVAAGAALEVFVKSAAAVAEPLSRLADFSGQSVESLSALEIAFAAGGVSAQQFVGEIEKLEERIAQVRSTIGTMADAIQESARRIEQAHNAVANAALSVASAEIALEEARRRAAEASGNIIVFDEEEWKRKKALLDVDKARQALIDARLRQQEAEKAARIAELNDIDKLIQKYRDLAAGKDAAFDPRVEQANKTKALLQLLAEAGKDWELVLADIVKHASELERHNIAKALDLDPKSLDRLKGGRAELEKIAATLAALHLPLTEQNVKDLNDFTAAWRELVAIWDAAKTKLGALLAPIATLFLQGLVAGLKAAITEIRNFISDVKRIPTEIANVFTGLGLIFDRIATGAATAWQTVIDWIGRAKQAILDFITNLPSNIWNAIVSGATDAWQTVIDWIGRAKDAIVEFVTSLPSDIWNAIVEGATTAWQTVIGWIEAAKQAVIDFVTNLPTTIWDGIVQGATTAWQTVIGWIEQAKQAINDFVANLPGDIFDALAASAESAWQRIITAIQAGIDKVRQFLGLSSSASAPDTGLEPSGAAAGGLIGGRGTGTSDSNLLWVSRGEHIMPARAVAQPGVLDFLEALRRSGGDLRRVLDGMGRFALGGLIMPRMMPAFATGGLVGGGSMHPVTINFPGVGPISGLRASADTVAELQRAAAMAQVRSGGRKPSRYS